MSTPLDRGSIVPFCVVCIEFSRATEATHQTKDLLCGCDQHIQELEQHGRAAIHRARRARYLGAVHGTLATAGSATLRRGLLIKSAARRWAAQRRAIEAAHPRRSTR